MTLFSDNDALQSDAPQINGPSWDPSGHLTDVQDMVESRISRSSFYHDVFRPAWKALEDAAATLLLEWFSGGLNTIGQMVSWYNQKQDAKEQEFYHAFPQRRNFPQAKPTPLESPLGLRKITGEQGKNGSFAVQNRDQQATGRIKPLQKTNPWLESAKKQTCVLNIEPPPPPKPARNPRPNRKFQVDDPIRGLDDIYTSPVSGFFVEDKDFSPAKSKPAATSKKSIVPALNTRTIAAMIDAELDQLLPSAKRSAKKAPSNDQPTETQSELDRQSNFKPASGAEPHESEFIPGYSSKEAPTTKTENESAVNSVIAETLPESEPNVCSPKPYNHNGASVMLAKAKSANLNFRQQMPVYQEMKNEMSGADHMVGNNRILHKSISNLTDAYFKKAAEEENSSHY